MTKGFRIADAYVAVTLDRDQLRDDLAKLPADLDPALEKAGKSAGKKGGKAVGDGMREGASGEKVGRDVVDDVEKGASPKARDSGKRVGDKMSKGMADAQKSGSPLIIAAIAAGLMAGGPLIAAAGASLFAGLAIAAVHSNADVTNAFTGLLNTAQDTARGVASQTVPMIVGALDELSGSVQQMAPTLSQLFGGLAPVFSDLAGGIAQLAENALPGLLAVVSSAGPLFAGLQRFLADIGSGLSGLFGNLAAYSGPLGQVFSDLGNVLGTLLPLLGDLLGVGAEVANAVLPPLAGALHLVADAVHVLAPVLPVVVAAIGGLMAAKALTAPLESLATKLSNLGTMGTGAGLGVLKLSSALPPLLASVGIIGGLMAASQGQINDWSNALVQGGQAAATATQQLSDAHTRSIADAHSLSDAWGIVKGAFADGWSQLRGYSSAADEAHQQAKAQYDSMTLLQQKQQDVTKAQADLNYAVATWGQNSAQTIGAAVQLRDAQSSLADAQRQANDAATKAALQVPGSTQALQALSNQAQGAQTNINLLKTALDALTGKATTQAQADIALTQALVGATTATQGHKGALVDASGALTVATDRGAAATSAFISMAGAGKQVIATLQQQGASSQDVANRTDAIRTQLINAAQQMGYTKAQAQQLADTYYGVPKQLETNIGVQVSGAGYASSVIDNAARDRYATIYTSTVTIGNHRGMEATGGPVGAMRVIARAAGGRVEGPGTGTSDSVGPIATPSGIPLYVSNDEWMVQASSARKYGDRAMAAVNAGTAKIVTPSGGSGGEGGATDGVTVQSMSITVNVTGGIVSEHDVSQGVLTAIQQGLVRLERARK